jgi:transitional endoplasmic reticulum ATPase
MSGLNSFDALRAAVMQSPDQVSLLLLYAHACMERRDWVEARAAFERVLVFEPDAADAQLGVARVLLHQGDVSGAAVRAERVLQQGGGNASAHVILSRVLLAEGDRARSLEHLQEALRLDGSVCDAVLEREFGAQLREARPAPSTEFTGESPPSEAESSTAEYAEPAGPEAGGEWRPEVFFSPGDPARLALGFDDIGGLDEIKEEIRLKMVYPLQFPDLYRAYGKRMGGGILLHGPPGCGKTMLLRAVAAEVPCNYFSVGLHEIFDPYLGSCERNLHQIFQTARANAPCVLVFDHLDSLAQDRRLTRDGPMRHLVNQFLHEMDSLRADQQRVLVLAATNQPWALDPAFRRPGRFDQVVAVGPPDDRAREQIVMLQARDKPIGQFDASALALATPGFSGADLRHVFERSAELTLAAAIHGGQPTPIAMETLLQVAAAHQPAAERWEQMCGLEPAPLDANPAPARKAVDRVSAPHRDPLT